ncbi:hypothetical protein L1049_013220 [Liquidambar formosana]|uniref:Uncharacterized protein n=1 Tax=Liquidambar formosana TaxID=63359 RepID=A0AAP0RPC0_LIQFO
MFSPLSLLFLDSETASGITLTCENVKGVALDSRKSSTRLLSLSLYVCSAKTREFTDKQKREWTKVKVAATDWGTLLELAGTDKRSRRSSLTRVNLTGSLTPMRAPITIVKCS